MSASLSKPRFLFVDELRTLLGSERRNATLLDMVLEHKQPAQLLSLRTVTVLAHSIVSLDKGHHHILLREIDATREGEPTDALIELVEFFVEVFEAIHREEYAAG